MYMGEGRGPVAPCIFMHGNDEVEGGLIVLFFGIVFSIGPHI